MGILDKARSRARAHSGPLAWYERLGLSHPNLMIEVDDTLSAWDRGELKENFSTRTQLAKFLVEEIGAYTDIGDYKSVIRYWELRNAKVARKSEAAGSAGGTEIRKRAAQGGAGVGRGKARAAK